MEPVEAARRSAQVAAVFDKVADTYDAVGVPWFEPIAAGLVAEVAPAPGERAIDLGTGRGAALWPLARAVGPTGRVTGLDLSAQMIAATRADALEQGLTTVDLLVADAARPELPDAGFDVAVASLVLFFLPDPAAALCTWRALLVPGGRLGVSTFGPRDTIWEELDDVFSPYLPPGMLDARTSGTRGPFASDSGVEELLTGAGFTGARTVRRDQTVRFADVQEWHRWSRSHGQRMFWEAVPADLRGEVLAAASERLEAAREGEGFTLTQQVRYTMAATCEAATPTPPR